MVDPRATSSLYASGIHCSISTVVLLASKLGSLPRGKQGVFVTQILSTVRLSEAHNTCRIQPPALGNTSRRDTKSQWDIIHSVYNNALVLGAVLGETAYVSLDDIGAIQEGHDTVGANPDLVTCVRS